MPKTKAKTRPHNKLTGGVTQSFIKLNIGTASANNINANSATKVIYTTFFITKNLSRVDKI